MTIINLTIKIFKLIPFSIVMFQFYKPEANPLTNYAVFFFHILLCFWRIGEINIHTQTREQQWNHSKIRRRRECRWRRLRRGSGRREGGMVEIIGSYRGLGHTRPIPTPPNLRLLCDEMPCHTPIMTSYMY